MKKYLLLLLAACQGLAVMAQTPDYKMKITMKNGTKLTARTDEVEDITFAKIGKMEVTISEKYKTSTSLGVNLEVGPNVSRIKAACVPASQTITDVKAFLEAKATVDYKGSYTKAFDFLTPETEYVVYAMAYDADGYVGDATQLKLTTGKVEDDPFVVETKNITTTTLDYVVSSKDPNVQFVIQPTGLDMYKQWCDEGANAGDVFQHFVNYWKAVGQMYGSSWQEMISLDARKGTYDSYADNNTQKVLLWDADQVIIVFGVSNEGELVTPIQITKARTLAPEPSSNKISLEIKTNEWEKFKGNVVVAAKTTNADTYLVNVQKASLVDPHLQSGDLAKWLLGSGQDYSVYAQSGDADWEFKPKEAGEKYYAIGIGLDAHGAPTTKPVIIDFVLAGGSSEK